MTVHTDGSVAADLALPTEVEFGELVPAVVDLLGGGGRRVVARLDGIPLDESKTLSENGICDGDILLFAEAPATLPVGGPGDACRVVADVASAFHDGRVSRRLGVATYLWAAGGGALVIAWSGTASASARAVIAAVLAVVATVGSIVAYRTAVESLVGLALGLTAVAFAAIAGFTAVPGGPAPPNFFLAAAICCAVSITVSRSAPAAICFTAVAAFATSVAIAAAITTIWPVPTAASGAVLSLVSLAILGASAKVSIYLAGLSPTTPSETSPAQAKRAHQTLTGLLTGFSASTALGAALVAVDRGEGTPSGVCLTAATAAVLLLRSRHQLGAVRRSAMLIAGMISATASFVLIVRLFPHHAQWMGLTAVLLGAGTFWLSVATPDMSSNPVTRRGVEVMEYVAIGAVVPLACWVADLFGLVRGLRLR